ncbi:MAG: hypothetical protein N3A53_07640, partial [Verrucomicrobiae bacterium]|nr:hypothetical protein [Verrucomicrobiae bacterium]
MIDSTIGGRACGGLRLRPDLQEAEVALLARAMTLKFGYLALPHGGAKAGVIGEAEAPPEVKRERLLAFARGIAPLLRSRGYAPHSDMGTTNADIRALLESVGLRVKRRELRGENSGYYTALSVMAGIREGARHVGLDLSRATV